MLLLISYVFNMKSLLLLIKGFLIGIAKIVPGVSGAVLSISFGVYERILNIIARPLKMKFEDIKFLMILFIGAALGIVLFCKIIKWCLLYYHLPTVFLFIGLIIGGMPEILSQLKKEDRKISDFFVLLVSLALVIFISTINGDYDESSNHYFLMGAIESFTTIVPGISGTAIFMALGWYNSLLETINSILTFSAGFDICVYFISGFINLFWYSRIYEWFYYFNVYRYII